MIDPTEQLIWTNELPSKPGWYWSKSKSRAYGEEITIIQVRDYAGELAIGNTLLEGCKEYSLRQWSGPIPLPEAKDKDKPMELSIMVNGNEDIGWHALYQFRHVSDNIPTSTLVSADLIPHGHGSSPLRAIQNLIKGTSDKDLNSVLTPL